jgi:hypothetical protein
VGINPAQVGLDQGRSRRSGIFPRDTHSLEGLFGEGAQSTGINLRFHRPPLSFRCLLDKRILSFAFCSLRHTLFFLSLPQRRRQFKTWPCPSSSLKPGAPHEGFTDPLPLRGIYFATQGKQISLKRKAPGKFLLQLKTHPNIIQQEQI